MNTKTKLSLYILTALIFSLGFVDHVHAAWYNASWNYRLSVTVNSSQVPSSQTNFPVYVNLDDLPDAFFSHVKSDGGDIRVTKSDGSTELPREVVFINTSSKTGELWFKADSVSSGTVFYIYYGNSGATEPTAGASYGSQNVWTNSYRSVYHLQQDPSGNGAGAVKDSTSNAYDLTPSGAPVNGTGKLAGNGITFDGTDDQLKNTTEVWANANDNVTVEAWSNFSSANTAQSATLFRFTTNGVERLSAHAPWTSQVYWDFGTCCSDSRVSGDYTPYDDQYSLLHFTSNGSTQKRIFINGTKVYYTDTAADNPNVDLTGFALGSGIDAEYHKGTIDEFKISTVERTADWITTEYNNQNSSTGFYTAGTEESGTLASVFFSVGQSTANLGVGSSVTMTGGAAVFTAAQTGNIGVGDRVTYNTSSIAYIAAKTNADMMHWTLVTATGGTPPDVTGVTVNSITHEYTSLSAAIAGASDANHINNANLTAANVILNIPCYNDSGTADTTAVTVSGYTTSATNYIKIYTPSNTTTESNLSQRHSGKWDDTKYNLNISLVAGSYGLKSQNNYVKVDGLQVKVSRNNYSASGINIDNPYGGNEVSNSIVTANITGTVDSGYYAGIDIPSTSATANKAYNNIVYGFKNSTSPLSGIHVSYGTAYVYNNTIYNSYYGIYRESAGTHVLKNNIANSNVTDYSGPFDASSTNNLSSDATAPGSNAKTNASVKFADAANKDFHLNFLDTAALNAGAAASDSNITFNTDIDGQARNTLGAWDIGADEATTPIYRSVGVGATAALTTGTNNGLVITGSTANFQAPLPDNVGVGDALQYDSNQDGTVDAIAFISYRIDSTHYIVKQKDGTAPTVVSASKPDTSWGIYRAYTSILNAVSFSIGGTENTGINSGVRDFDTWTSGKDLVAVNQQWNVTCYANGNAPDNSGAVNIYSSWVTSYNNNLRIYTPTSPTEVGVSQRHTGKWDASKYNIYYNEVSNYTPWFVDNYSEYIKIDGLQIYVTNTTYGQSDAFSFGSLPSLDNRYEISNNIITGNVANYSAGINFGNTGKAPTAYIYNNLIYDLHPTSYGSSAGITINHPSARAFVYNNTVVNSDECLRASGTTVAKNNLIKGCGNTTSYIGTFATGTDNNATDSTDAIGTGSNNRISQTFTFINESGKDFHLANTDVGAKNVGADLTADTYLPITTDIDGQPRMSGSAFDIGADERLTNVYYSVSGGGDTSTDRKVASTIAITNGILSSSAPQTGNIGVGDEVIYGAGSKAYISGKIDQSNWYVVTATGDKPADVAAGTTLTSIKRVWTSLSAAIAGAKGASYINNADLKAAGVILNIPCYYDTGSDTTGVSVTGYTTGTNNYIRIYTPSNTATEANNSQRHSGKWDDMKYNMKLSAGADSQNNLYLSVAVVRVDGLQLQATNNGYQYVGTIASNSSTAPKTYYISNNILKGVSTVTQSDGWVDWYGAAGNYYLWNNIAYDFTLGSGFRLGDAVGFAQGTHYAYNNTAYNCKYGFFGAGGAANDFAKNNLAISSLTADYTGAFNSSSVGNISSDVTSPNTSLRSKTVSFVDPVNKDFHLGVGDTAATNAGVDLSFDPNLPITTDIDGHTRNANLVTGNFDIGADEATTKIYRSVASGATGNIGTSAQGGTFSVSGNIGTFTTAPGTHVGVGDVIQYDSDNNGSIDSIAFISGRTSATQYTLQNTIGGTPTATSAPDADWNLFRAYTTLANAETGTENTGINATYRNFDAWASGKNISAANEQWSIAAYANSTNADTAAVTIQDWTTTPNNYFKVYTPTVATEVGVSQRVQGKWDTSKYYRDTSAAGYPYNNFTINDKYVRIEGLQIIYGNSGSATTVTGIVVSPNTLFSDVQISSSIIRGNTNSTYRYVGIRVDGNTNGANVKIFNNIIYDTSNFNTGAGSAIIFRDYDPAVRGYALIYNNTVKSEQYGITNSYNSYYITAKNNISYGDANDYSGTFEVTSSNNISKDATSPNSGSTDCGGHSCRNQTVQFADAVNNDFHLASNDTAARNAGADLSLDSGSGAGMTMTTDIDGHTRNAAVNAWDIGADEGATAIYYSVGQSTATDLKSGTPKISLSGYAATFDAAQTGNIGVGDLVAYTGGSCFISGKTSTTVWNCQNATGGTAPQVSGVSVTSIKRAFGSLESAVDANLATSAKDANHLNTTDLNTNNYQLNIPCYYDTGADTTSTSIQSWTTAAPNYIKVYAPNNTTTEANNSQRHQGKWDDTKYNLAVTGTSSSLNIYVPYTQIVGLQVSNSGNYTIGIYLQSTTNNSLVDSSIIKGAGTPANSLVGVNNASASNSIINSIVYGYSGSVVGFKAISSVGNLYVYNTTVAKSHYGFYQSFQNIKAVNTISYQNDIGHNLVLSNYISGTDYNISDLNDAPGANSKNGVTVSFIDATNDDYHLAIGDTAARNAGISLSSDSNFAFSTDIDGQTRKAPWDIGADEVFAPIPVYYSVGQTAGDLKTGTPTLTISGGTGTFLAAQTGNIGVGDRVTYNTSSVAYIAAKSNVDMTQWKLITVTGDTPADVSGATVNSITHTYTTLQAAIQGAGTLLGNVTDLTANGANVILNIPCYMDSGTADTTAVTISGYTTGPANYIKVYTPTSTTTEANFSQRHQGKWDDSKYSLQPPLGTDQALTVSLDYSVVDGIQIKSYKSDGNGAYGIWFQSTNGQAKNNIVVATGTSSGIAILTRMPGAMIYNNLLYSLGNTSRVGVEQGNGNSSYIYNNTIATGGIGISNVWGTIVAKNNLIKGCSTSASGTFAAGTDYNATDISSMGYTVTGGGNTHDKTSQSFNFVDASHYDFHLAKDDTAAREAGADLTNDANLKITTDIDGHTRPTLGATDIGADEGATYIYYSVGQNTTDHKTGSPTITLSGYNATLSVAQTAPNMGVGDLITYTGGSCYIAGKTDTQHWSCQNATGGTAPQVSGVSVTSIAHAFDSLHTAVSYYGGFHSADSSHLNTQDLKTGNYALNIPCYYDTGQETLSNGRIFLTNWITALPNYIKIYTPDNTATEVNQTQRAGGKWDNAKYGLYLTSPSNYTRAIDMYDIAFVKVDGMQIYINDPTHEDATGVGNYLQYPGYQSNRIEISNSIITGSVLNYAGGISVMGNDYVYNNIIYDLRRGAGFGSSIGIYVTGTSTHSYLYNNTVINSDNGIQVAAGSNAVAKNNMVQNCSDGYVGTFSAGSDYNISDVSSDNTGGANDKQSAITFKDATNKDFHLSPDDTGALNAGTDLSVDAYLAFSTDIDGQSRKSGQWDIGADEISATVDLKGGMRLKGGVRLK